MKNLKEIQRTALTDIDIRRILGQNTKILKYGELDDYSSIDHLLGASDFVVILVETEVNSGHWVCLLRYPDRKIIEWFDSYGLYPDDELKYVNLQARQELDELTPELTYLLDACPYQVVYNKTDLQEWKKGINTCGRHVCLRLLNIHKPLPQYIAYVKSFDVLPDVLVCRMIN